MGYSICEQWDIDNAYKDSASGSSQIAMKKEFVS